MFLTLDADRTYLENKYHDTQKPFNPYRRMAYHGYAYDPATGLDDEAMQAGLKAMEKDLESLPHPQAKARAVAFVLDNARIDVNPHDWFVGFYNWGRPANGVTVGKWSGEVFGDLLPEVGREMGELNASGAVSIWADFDHVVPDWDSLLTLGFPGLLERVRRYHERFREVQDADALFTAMETEYEAILRLLDRYVAYAERQTHDKAQKTALCLRHLRDGAPQNLYEALQAIYLFFIICECVDSYQTRSLGNGLDETLRPFVERDLQNGAAIEEEREYLAYFLMQFSAIGNYWGHPLYLGGTDAAGKTRVTAVSHLILDTYRELKIYNPKIQIKVDPTMPRDFLRKALEMVRDENASLVFVCEPGMKQAIMSYGATWEEACDFDIRGCYETGVRKNEVSAGTGYVNAVKAVLYVLRNGWDEHIHQHIGVETGALSRHRTFDDFYAAFLKQWGNLIERSIALANAYDPYLDYINPSLTYTATVETALEKGVDGYAKGAKFENSALLNCGFATAVDALMAVRELVYEKALCTLEELEQALTANWEGSEALRRAALTSVHKYGNHDEATDRMAAALSRWFCMKVANRENGRGGVYKPIMHTAMQFVWQGEKTGASPDGRKAGEEISKNASPTVGMDRSGVTALVTSAIGLIPCLYTESFCLDLMLHPSAVAGEAGIGAMEALLLTYCNGGGMSLQFNIFSVETLHDAQEHPEKYQNLQVRVCGWNVLWNNLSRKEQDAYIRRAENIAE